MGSPKPRERQGDRAAIVSRRSHDLPGSAGKRHAGQRAAGGTFQKCTELAGCVMHKSFLILFAMRCFFSLESGMLGNEPVPFGKGATEKVREEPRWCPTSFGGRGSKKGRNSMAPRRLPIPQQSSTNDPPTTGPPDH